jgi:hypothetical protein
MNEQYTTLKSFVLAANALAEQVQKDIQAGIAVDNKKPIAVITNETVVKLSHFYKAQERFQKGIDVLNAMNADLN